MSNFHPRNLRLRAILADTLPFEVPIIYTNDFFFSSTLPLKVNPQTERVLDLLRSRSGFTIPYNYRITKDRGRTTELSIIHPIVQLRWAAFIDRYAETVLAYCSKGDQSLRRPFAVVAQHTSAPLEKEATARDGLPHELLDEKVPDYSRMSSYFRIKRYNLLAKFLESDELIALEKRYSHMLSLDVSKCFYNIYTHSIAWAVKSKKFAKRQIGTASFEHEFDELMQAANYKETNGIVVGPEISRIFAEIILQEIDKTTLEAAELAGIARTSFEIRRYVDDYFIFASSVSEVEKIEEILASALGNFKLYLNPDKRVLAMRPFVTQISKTKKIVASVIDEISDDIRFVAEDASFCDFKRFSTDIRGKLRDLRIAVSPDEVGFHNISGWLMWKLRRICVETIEYMNSVYDEAAIDCASQILSSIMDLAFYVCALDFRVRTGFNLALLITMIQPMLERRDMEQYAWLSNLLFERTVELLEVMLVSREIVTVEICNLLLLGAHAFKERFVRTKCAERAILSLSQMPGNYRAYVTSKFCMLKAQPHFARALSAANEAAIDYITKHRDDIWVDTECYLLTCDFVSSPDVDVGLKQGLLDIILETDRDMGRVGLITAVSVAELARLVGFVDWTGVRLHHTLVRRQLRGGREY